jgi:hypothetical protein
MLIKRIKVAPNHRTLVIRNGDVCAILKPGRHVLFVPPFVKMQTETHRLQKVVFRSRWADNLLRKQPRLAREHFNIVETNDSQVAMISLNGSLYQVLPPARRAMFWKDAGNVSVEFITIIEGPALGETQLTALEGGDQSLRSELIESLLDDEEEYSSTSNRRRST